MEIPMEYRNLGRTGLKVSEICLGTMQFSWTTDEETSRQVMDAFLDAGGNFIDTANVYTQWAEGGKGGEAETIIGKWMKERKNRQDVVLATKVRGPMWEGPNGEGLSRAHIFRAVEDSLRRLQTDYIDLYQAHWADVDTPIEETLETFADLVGQGKVRYIGASNYISSWRLMEALAASERLGLPAYISYQPCWSLVERETLEKWTSPLLRKYGLGVIPYSPLAGGFLTGKYRKDKPLPDSKRADNVKKYMTDQGYAVIDKCEQIGKKHDKTISQVALAWLLAHPETTAPIIGANNTKQLSESLGAAGFVLSAEEKAVLDEVSAWDKPQWPPVYD
jgi:aryl-alcohol dehydrogenase-like predicted oxidoreductase